VVRITERDSPGACAGAVKLGRILQNACMVHCQENTGRFESLFCFDRFPGLFGFLTPRRSRNAPQLSRRLCAETGSPSGNENRGTFEAAGAEIGQSLVGLPERIARGSGNDTDLRREAQEIDAVVSREIGDRHELPLFPQ
jgi:hypothetical protein